jgi:peptidyl-prolyl cis-trans isomerase SurA
VKGPQSLADSREELKKTYQQYRYNDDYAAYVEKLKRDFHYAFNDSLFDAFASGLDSTKNTEDSAWTEKIPETVRQQWIMLIAGKNYSLDTVLKVFSTKQDYRGTSLRKHEIKSKFDRIAESFLFNQRANGTPENHELPLEERYPEFATLMKDYRDGIVLFKAEQQEVWNKISIGDSALRAYYNQNKEKFKMPAKLNYAEIHLSSDTLAMLVYDSLTRGADFSKLADRYNDDPELKKKHGVHGFLSVTTDEITRRADSLTVGEISDPIENENGGFSIVKVIAKEPPRVKTFEEAGAEVSNALQESESKRLEATWLDRLKSKYPVKHYRDKLAEAFQSSAM